MIVNAGKLNDVERRTQELLAELEKCRETFPDSLPRFERARNQLAELYTGMVNKIAAYACRSADPAWEDILCDGYLALLRAIETFDPTKGKSFRNWIWTGVRNAVSNRRSAERTYRNHFRQDTEEEVLDHLTSNFSLQEELECGEVLSKALSLCSAQEEDILVRISEGESDASIGRALGLERRKVRRIFEQVVQRIRDNV